MLTSMIARASPTPTARGDLLPLRSPRRSSPTSRSSEDATPTSPTRGRLRSAIAVDRALSFGLDVTGMEAEIASLKQCILGMRREHDAERSALKRQISDLKRENSLLKLRRPSTWEATTKALRRQLSTSGASSTEETPPTTPYTRKREQHFNEEEEEPLAMPASLREFRPLSKNETVAALSRAPALRDAEDALLTAASDEERAEATAALAPLAEALWRATEEAALAMIAERNAVVRCRRVVKEGNSNFADIYDSMWAKVVKDTDPEALADYYKAAGELAVHKQSTQRQRAAGFAEVYADASAAKPLYDALLAKIRSGLSFDLRPETCIPQRLKSTGRILEKALLRGGKCDSVCDVVRGMLVCSSMAELAALLRALTTEDDIVLTRMKQRFADEGRSDGGWRDCMINFYLKADPNRHNCEVQLVHHQMLVARKGLDGHAIYNRVRNASELLEMMMEGCSDWSLEQVERAGFTLEDRIRMGHATDAEARAGGFSTELVALRQRLSVAAADGDVDLSRRLQMHVDARQVFDVELGEALRAQERLQKKKNTFKAEIASALERGDHLRAEEIGSEEKLFEQQLLVLTRQIESFSAGAAMTMARHLAKRGASLEDLVFLKDDLVLRRTEAKTSVRRLLTREATLKAAAFSSRGLATAPREEAAEHRFKAAKKWTGKAKIIADAEACEVIANGHAREASRLDEEAALLKAARLAIAEKAASSELGVVDFSAAVCRKAGFDALSCRRCAVVSTAADCREAGFDALSCREAGFNATECFQAGFHALECQKAGLIGSATSGSRAGFDALSCKEAGLVSSAADCKDAGFDASACKLAGFDAAQCKRAGYSASDCKLAGFDARECKLAGFSLDGCKRAGLVSSARDCRDAGFTAKQARKQFDATEISKLCSRKDAGWVEGDHIIAQGKFGEVIDDFEGWGRYVKIRFEDGSNPVSKDRSGHLDTKTHDAFALHWASEED